MQLNVKQQKVNAYMHNVKQGWRLFMSVGRSFSKA